MNDEERIARLETAMAEMAAATAVLTEAMAETRADLVALATVGRAEMIETRADIRRLYEAWPDQMRAMAEAAETVRRRSGETDAAMVNELQRIHDRLSSIEDRLG